MAKSINGHLKLEPFLRRKLDFESFCECGLSSFFQQARARAHKTDEIELTQRAPTQKERLLMFQNYKGMYGKRSYLAYNNL